MHSHYPADSRRSHLCLELSWHASGQTQTRAHLNNRKACFSMCDQLLTRNFQTLSIVSPSLSAEHGTRGTLLPSQRDSLCLRPAHTRRDASLQEIRTLRVQIEKAMLHQQVPERLAKDTELIYHEIL